MARLGLLTGKMKPAPLYVAEESALIPVDLGPTFGRPGTRLKRSAGNATAMI